jgi:hypothetical protein
LQLLINKHQNKKIKIMKKIILLFLISITFNAVKALPTDSSKTKSNGIRSIEVSLSKAKRDTTFTKNDTTTIRIGHLKIKINPKAIQVTRDSSVHKIKKPKMVENNWLGLDLGLCNLYQTVESVPQIKPNTPFSLRQSKCINVKLYLIQQRVNLYQHKVNFRWGLGLNWNNYRFKNSQNISLLTDQTDGTVYTQLDTVQYSKNKFVTKFITVPLMIELKLGKKNSWKAFSVAAGVEANLLVDAWQKQIVERSSRNETALKNQHGGRQSHYEGDYNLTQFPLNYVMRLGVGKLNFYGTYAISPMFNSSQQANHYMPKMYPWAVGIQLNGL